MSMTTTTDISCDIHLTLDDNGDLMMYDLESRLNKAIEMALLDLSIQTSTKVRDYSIRVYRYGDK